MRNHTLNHCGQRRPMVDQGEVGELSSAYGVPFRRAYDVKAGGSILEYRWRKDSDRRAEVIFAIQGPGEQIWLHTKHRYERPMFRLPTGGIDPNEPVVSALLREVEEEAGVQVEIQRFVALLEYEFYQAVAHEQGANADNVHIKSGSVVDGAQTITRASFASYLFLLKNLEGPLKAYNNEEVAQFRSIMPRQLPQVAADLRNIMGPRREWGHWRAISHDVLYEALHSAR